jgi:hypothetical protein
MNELHSHRTLADTGSYALHRAMAHVTHGKHSGNIGLEKERESLVCESLVWSSEVLRSSESNGVLKSKA